MSDPKFENTSNRNAPKSGENNTSNSNIQNTFGVTPDKNGVVQLSLSDLQKVVQDAVDTRIKSIGDGNGSPSKNVRYIGGGSFDLDDSGLSSPPMDSGTGKSLGSNSISSGDELIDGGGDTSPLSGRGSSLGFGSRVLQHASQSSGAFSSSGDIGDYNTSSMGGVDGLTVDCDPRAWILAAGRLEKKRDGNWKAGWGKRFFVLTTSTLYYFLVPKRGGKGETNALLGDERGQIRVADILDVRTSDSSDGFLIHLNCDEVKKQNFTQSSNTSIILKASTKELQNNWADLLRQARDYVKQSAGRFSKGRGNFIEGVIPFRFTAGYMFDKNTGKDQEDLKAIRKLIHEQVLPLIKTSKDVVHPDGCHAPHIDPYLALGCLVCINSCCYIGPSLGDVSIWLLVNIVFSTFIVYYEKLANDHDATVFRFNRAIKTLNNNLSTIGLNLEKCAGKYDEMDQQQDGGKISSQRSLQTGGDDDDDNVDERKTGAGGGGGPPMAGTTMEKVDDGVEDRPISWTPGDANGFKVRQVGYKSNKQKGPSKSDLYDLVDMDLLRADGKIDCVHKIVQLPKPRECDDLEKIKQSGLPRIFIVHIQVPMKMPSPWGSDDPGVSVVFYFAIKPETVEAAIENQDRPEVKLFKRFVTEWDTNDDMRRRFKGIGVAANFKDLNLSKFESLNGKPVILLKSAQNHRAEDCHEITISVAKFGIIPRGIFHQFKELSETIKIRAGFVIQGETDDELPECIFGCAKIHNLNFARAKHINEL